MKHVRELFQPSVRLVAHPVGRPNLDGKLQRRPLGVPNTQQSNKKLINIVGARVVRSGGARKIRGIFTRP